MTDDFNHMLQETVDGINRSSGAKQPGPPAAVMTDQVFNGIARKVAEAMKTMANRQVDEIVARRTEALGIIDGHRAVVEKAFLTMERDAHERRDQLHAQADKMLTELTASILDAHEKLLGEGK